MSKGYKQRVGLAQALIHDPNILILDEPTAVLTPPEIEQLFSALKQMAGRGKAIIFISHKLEELLQVGDYITVLRDGKVVAHAEAADIDVAWIIEQMVGRSPASLFSRTEHDVGEVLLEVRDVTLRLYSDAADYALSRGIIIADTKFEFGLGEDGRLFLIDEILTPDSSRFWPARSYRPGISPPSFDKQFVRDYLETLDWNKQTPGPHLPEEIIQHTSEKYLEALRLLTGEPGL